MSLKYWQRRKSQKGIKNTFYAQNSGGYLISKEVVYRLYIIPLYFQESNGPSTGIGEN